MDRLFHWSDPFFTALCYGTWQASILVLIVLFVQWALRKKLSPAWRYNLWWLVLIRLALPFTPESSFSLFNIRAFEPLRILKQRVTFGIAPLPRTEPVAKPGWPPMEKSRTENTVDTVLRWIPRIWLLGVVLLAIRFLVQNARFSKRIRQRMLIDDPVSLALLESCRQTMNVPHRLVLFETHHVRSPALYGLFRPRLLLPENLVTTFSADELRHILLHELAHVKRADMVVNWLMSVLQTLHWFNPVVWFAFNRMRADRETACDALVLSKVEQGQARVYGEAILKLLERFARPATAPSLLGILEDKSQMERRIRMIANFTRFVPWRGWAISILLLLAVVGLTDAAGPRFAPPGPLPVALLREPLDTDHPQPFTLVSGTVIDDETAHAIDAFQVRVIFTKQMPPGSALVARDKKGKVVIDQRTNFQNLQNFKGFSFPAQFHQLTNGSNGQFSLMLNRATRFQVEIQAPGYHPLQSRSYKVERDAEHMHFRLRKIDTPN
jgi:bla regulator protein BlaR1